MSEDGDAEDGDGEEMNASPGEVEEDDENGAVDENGSFTRESSSGKGLVWPISHRIPGASRVNELPRRCLQGSLIRCRSRAGELTPTH